MFNNFNFIKENKIKKEKSPRNEPCLVRQIHPFPLRRKGPQRTKFICLKHMTFL